MLSKQDTGPEHQELGFNSSEFNSDFMDLTQSQASFSMRISGLHHKAELIVIMWSLYKEN